MTEVTPAQAHKLNRDPVSDAHLVFLEFQEDGTDTIHRAVVNNEDVTFQGEVYSMAAITGAFPGSGDSEVRTSLEISNIDRKVSRAIDAAKARINVRLFWVDVSNPDVAIFDTGNLLVIQNANGNSTRITAELWPRASLLEPVRRQTTEATHPGVWFA